MLSMPCASIMTVLGEAWTIEIGSVLHGKSLWYARNGKLVRKLISGRDEWR